VTTRVTVTHKTQAQLATGGADLSATAFGKQWQKTKSDVGSGQVQLANNDANLPAITYGDFVRFDLDGTPDFLMLVEAIDTVSIAPAEEVDEVTTITGRGSLAQWEQAIVLPPNGVAGQPYTETRVFDWGAAELHIAISTAAAPTRWQAAVLLTQVGQGSEGAPPPEFPERWLGYPLGWSDPTGYWVWSEAAGAGPAMPAGTSYFARDVNVPTAGYYAVYMAADNRYTLKIDGVVIDTFEEEQSQEGYQYTRRADLFLTAGIHRIAAKVTNDSATELAGFVSALWSQDAERNDDTLILRADDSWSAIGYPDVAPGFTAGHVIRILLEEAQDNGALTGWTLDFTDTVDSEGNAWPVDQQFSFRVGMDLLSVLRQLGSSDIDYIADPASLTLHAYVIDGMGVAADAATATLSDLSYLEYQGRA
jgi:hypothetical protein